MNNKKIPTDRVIELVLQLVSLAISLIALFKD